MADDNEQPRVVDLKGKAIAPRGDTNPEIIELLKDFLAKCEAGNYRAVSIALVDANHLAITGYHHDPTFGLSLTGALSYMKYRINKRTDED